MNKQNLSSMIKQKKIQNKNSIELLNTTVQNAANRNVSMLTQMISFLHNC